jgi:hypothetical protein
VTLFKDREPKKKNLRPPMGRTAKFIIFGIVIAVFAYMIYYLVSTGQSFI